MIQGQNVKKCNNLQIQGRRQETREARAGGPGTQRELVQRRKLGN